MCFISLTPKIPLFTRASSCSSSSSSSSTWCDGRSLGLSLLIQHRSCWDWQKDNREERIEGETESVKRSQDSKKLKSRHGDANRGSVRREKMRWRQRGCRLHLCICTGVSGGQVSFSWYWTHGELLSECSSAVPGDYLAPMIHAAFVGVYSPGPHATCRWVRLHITCAFHSCLVTMTKEDESICLKGQLLPLQAWKQQK